MDIPLQGRYTGRQLRRALALDQGRARRIALVAYVVVVVLFVVADVVAAIVGATDAGTLLWSSLRALLMLVLLGGVPLVIPWLQTYPYLLRRTPLYRKPVSGVANDEGLVLRGEGVVMQLRWDSCIGYEMSQDLVLLYAKSEALTTVPRAFFAGDDEWQRFREHVQGVLPRQPTTSASVLRWLLVAGFIAALAACAILSILAQALPGAVP